LLLFLSYQDPPDLDCNVSVNHAHCTKYKYTLRLSFLTFEIPHVETDAMLVECLAKPKKGRLIIFDDFGLQPMSHSIKLVLLQIT